MATKLLRLFKNISTPLVIEEDITRVSSDIASCGPAFFSYLLQCFINAAVDKTNITHEEATTLVSEMVVGWGNYLKRNLHITYLTRKGLRERRRYWGRHSGFRRARWRYVP